LTGKSWIEVEPLLSFLILGDQATMGRARGAEIEEDGDGGYFRCDVRGTDDPCFVVEAIDQAKESVRNGHQRNEKEIRSERRGLTGTERGAWFASQ
jgi:hypothetical protein